MSDWWRAVEGALERLGDDGPDPWADVDAPAPADLTPEQRAFLEQVAGTPTSMFTEADLLDEVAADGDASDPAPG